MMATIEDVKQLVKDVHAKGCKIHFCESEPCTNPDELLAVFKREIYCWELKQLGVHPAVAFQKSLLPQ